MLDLPQLKSISLGENVLNGDKSDERVMDAEFRKSMNVLTMKSNNTFFVLTCICTDDS